MTDQATATAAVESDNKIVCHIDNARVHSVQIHIKNNYADTWTLERYMSEFPDEPVLSDYAKDLLVKKQASNAAKAAPAAASSIITNIHTELVTKTALFNELFDLGTAPAAMNAKGKPIAVTTLDGHDDHSILYLPPIDDGYIFNIDLLKKVIIGFELGMNVYLWGFHGTGKTTILRQAAARTRRPFVRVQHTINMQESDVLGQWTVREGSTVFQPGPLTMAMVNGWVYCADEYDFAMPAVSALYQPVLEGEELLIKDAPIQYRKITPHPQFRFVATGNTNGIGDETGLYQGTLVQNAANFSRFQITEEVDYMEPKIEESVIISRAQIGKPEAKNIVKFGGEIRKMFREGKLSMTVSPRELISAAMLGRTYGGNWTVGIQLAFANRLSRVDRKVAMDYAQRLFA